MKQYTVKRALALASMAILIAACTDSNNNSGPAQAAQPVPADEDSVYAAANQCVAISVDDRSNFITTNESGDGYQVIALEPEQATRFMMRPADLGIYLLYDEDEHYFTSDGEVLTRQSSLAFDTNLVDGQVVIEDGLQSEGEWQLIAIADGFFTLRHIKSDAYLSATGTMTDEPSAANIALVEQAGCAVFPELSVDATGEITKTEFGDGSVFGFVDTHSHLLANFAFGGSGVFHGAPFHRLGVEHALEDCALVHGEEGRKDFMGGLQDGDITDFVTALIAGELPQKNHDTEGYPAFTAWPDAHRSATHQVQYYKWVERAWLSGLRLLVQHAYSNEVQCQLVVGIGAQPRRYDCNDMVAVDRIIEETYALERYIDALSGGPGQGWFRIVFSPEQAREEIKAGKLAVVLGIETSDLFDCFLVPFGDFSTCAEADVVAKLDQYYDRGVRVLFPVHKYDNAFSAGDGHRGIIELGNFLHTGHYANFVQCSEDLLSFPGGFDKGGATFAAFTQPREIFDAQPPFDMSNFPADPIGTILANVGLFIGGSLEGEYCQNHGLTELGEFLMAEMMKRGMIIEVDHFPRKSYQRTYEILV